MSVNVVFIIISFHYEWKMLILHIIPCLELNNLLASSVFLIGKLDLGFRESERQV